MTAPGTQQLVDAFTNELSAHLDPDRLDGPVRLDNTRTVAIIPLKGKGPIHVHIDAGINDEGVAEVVKKLRAVPSLQALVVSQTTSLTESASQERTP